MTKQTQQMPLLMIIGSIAALTEAEVKQIKKYMQLGTILDVQFKDADGDVMIPVAFSEEVTVDDVTTPATITVIKDGSVVQADVKLGAPVISGETPFETKTEVTIAAADEGARIFYTVDGETPTTESTEYSEPIELTATTTVKAIAVSGELQSAVSSKTFTKS